MAIGKWGGIGKWPVSNTINLVSVVISPSFKLSTASSELNEQASPVPISQIMSFSAARVLHEHQLASISQIYRLSVSAAGSSGEDLKARKITQQAYLSALGVNLQKNYNPFDINLMKTFSYLALSSSIGINSSTTKVIQYFTKGQVIISAVEDINVNNVRLYSGDSIHQFKSNYQH